MPSRRQAIIGSDGGLVYWCINSSGLGFNELTSNAYWSKEVTCIWGRYNPSFLSLISLFVQRISLAKGLNYLHDIRCLNKAIFCMHLIIINIQNQDYWCGKFLYACNEQTMVSLILFKRRNKSDWKSKYNWFGMKIWNLSQPCLG